ncbi:MAG: hypothetical protein KDB50_00065 [Mycobacterium sp.]|nr:hypothetical protein [Mycobacterium sp.]
MSERTIPRRILDRIVPGLVGFAVIVCAALIVTPTTPPAGGQPDGAQFLQVRLDSVSPDVVTTSSEPNVTVTATVINIGDRPVRDVLARLEHAPAVTTTEGLRTSIATGSSGFEPSTEFIEVATELARGQAASLNFVVPIRPGPPSSLNIDTPGVYPLLINVNGTPDYGAPARLDQRSFLLPVTGVPPDPAAGNQLADVVAPDTSRPVGVTMLWPLADKPRLAPGVPGGTTPVRLMNDDLAVSLAPGGRLDTLLAAAEFVVRPDAIEPGPEVDRALCLAVDPDLLVTVNAMTGGYVVADAADGLGTASHPGAGQTVAVAWLDRLRNVARRLCVTATPYAQADLGALHRVGSRVLAGAATRTGADVVDQILGVASTRGVTILGDGPLTASALALLADQDGTVVVAAQTDPEPRRLSARVTLAPFDPAVGAALAAVGTDPAVPGYFDPDSETPLNRESPVARRQDAVAAVLWKLLTPQDGPRNQILVPPAKWSPQPDDARLILTTLANSLRSGLATARPLAAVLAETAGTPTSFEPAQLPTSERGQFDDDVVGTIAAEIGRLQGLGAALTTDARTGLTGPQYTAPLREDMLRALSRTEPAQARNDLARQRLAVVGKTIGDLFKAVTIVNPGDSYTLATERSALPLALRNDLAVPIRVHLQVDAPPGMAVTDIGEQELPPGYLPLRVPVEVHITQRVAVDVTLRTPEGLQLGEPVRLSVHSNAYGKTLFAITLTGGAVLALLVGRRLYHRFRGQPDRADLDRPDDRHRYDDLADL